MPTPNSGVFGVLELMLDRGKEAGHLKAGSHSVQINVKKAYADRVLDYSLVREIALFVDVHVAFRCSYR